MCGVDRSAKTGFCGETETIRAARAALHFGEEPCISGVRGSGTVFFSGCTLRCVFCQNYDLSQGRCGQVLTPEQLSGILLNLQAQGAHNINFVTPTHFLPGIRRSAALCGDRLSLPLLCNCGGYERTETVAACSDLFDVWMPDLKFYDPALSLRYLRASDYFDVASRAILQMRAQTGVPQFNGDGMLTRGVLVRHLVMPGCLKDSLRLIDWLRANFGPEDLVISLMSQYLPCGRAEDFPEIDRRVTTYEYRKAADALADAGFVHCYTQDRAASTRDYIPEWNGEGLPASK